MAKIGTILVVGGGVAGLATAAALHRRGFTTELVERQQTWHTLGAGFLVHGNGMRMLLSLGLAAGVEKAGTVVRRWQFCDEQGGLLSETDLETLWGDAGPCVGIERSKLQGALAGRRQCTMPTRHTGHIPGAGRSSGLDRVLQWLDRRL
jgi:2-polyprenyl-6-methoxyphenol hydroxylase-like FAD-dependent oxidoreductase